MARICIVYADPERLNALEDILSAEEDFELVGAFASGRDAARAMQLKWLRVDVLVVDMELPDDFAIRLITQASALNQFLLSIVYGAFDDQKQALEVLGAGAYGYVLKGSEESDIVDNVRQLLDGGSPMSPVVARKIISSFWRNKLISNRELLSLREKEILQSISSGMTYQEVAFQMNRSPHTIHSHVKNIYSKLNVSNRRHAISKARMLGLIDG